jgi:hypothetical protein
LPPSAGIAFALNCVKQKSVLQLFALFFTGDFEGPSLMDWSGIGLPPKNFHENQTVARQNPHPDGPSSERGLVPTPTPEPTVKLLGLCRKEKRGLKKFAELTHSEIIIYKPLQSNAAGWSVQNSAAP